VNLRAARLEQTKDKWNDKIAEYKKVMKIENSVSLRATDSIAQEKKMKEEKKQHQKEVYKDIAEKQLANQIRREEERLNRLEEERRLVKEFMARENYDANKRINDLKQRE
jgi:hypothetical protein